MSSYVEILTIGHTALSIAALLSGLVVVADLAAAAPVQRFLQTFLVTAAVTSVTGFFFPFNGFTPAIGVGIVACVILALVFVARGRAAAARGWSAVYAGGLVASEYLLVFVTIAQAFNKIPALHAAAPTLQEAPFKASQGAALLVFVVLGVLAIKRYPLRAPRGAAPVPAPRP